MFYYYHAHRQGTNSVYATSTFCKNGKGLGWSSKRFWDTKKVLIREGFITQKKIKDKKTKSPKQEYIVVNFFYDHNIECSHGETIHGETIHSDTTNALYKNIKNTNNKEEEKNMKEKEIQKEKEKNPEEIEGVFNLWNNSGIKGLTVHESIMSKVTSRNKKLQGMWFTPTIYNAIDYILSQFSYSQIIQSIKNYLEIFPSDQYWYTINFKTLPEFLLNNKGLRQFLPENNPHQKFIKNQYKPEDVIDALRKKFIPITTIYSPTELLSVSSNTYYGFKTEELNNAQYINGLIYDIKAAERGLSFSYFNFLEKAISSLLFRRKHIDITELLIELIAIWVMNKDKHEGDAKMWRDNQL